MVMAGLGIVLWYLVGKSAYLSTEGALTDNWRLGTILAVGLGFGNGSGNNIIEVLINSIKDHIQQLISIAVAMVVGINVWILLVEGGAFDGPRVIHVVATYIGAAITTSIIISCFKKSAP